MTVVDTLNSFYADNFFQARSICTTFTTATVTFHEIEMAPGDVTTQVRSRKKYLQINHNY
jgi:hypothetical protein